VNSVSQCGHLCFFVVEGDLDMRPGVSGAGKLMFRWSPEPVGGGGGYDFALFDLSTFGEAGLLRGFSGIGVMADEVADRGGLNGLDIASGLLVICGGSILEDVCGGGTLEPNMRGGCGDLSDTGGCGDNADELIICCVGRPIRAARVCAAGFGLVM
jgi:hypothetical protein